MQVVARIPPQGNYPNGQEMCTICSSMLSMAMASGLFPSTTKEDSLLCDCAHELLESMLTYLMEHSSMLQTEWLVEEKKKGHRQRQIMEVIQFIQSHDTMNMWSVDSMVECFGTLQPSKEELGAVDGMLVADMPTLLEEKMKCGQTLVITYGNHTISLHKHAQDERQWYGFDSLVGEFIHICNADGMELASRLTTKFVEQPDMTYCGVILQ